MMDETNHFAPAAALPQPETPAEPAADPAATPAPSASPSGMSPGASALAPPAPTLSPAVEKFKSCRWRAAPDVGDYCTHRDVLPFAGKEGFSPDSWCPECLFYKLRRTPKKRERIDFSY
jgi:hypothetical protein